METSRKPQAYHLPCLVRSISPAVQMTSISKPAFNFHGHFTFLHWGSQHSSTAGVKKSDPEPIKTNGSLWINSNDPWTWPWFRLKCCHALGIQARLDVTGFCYFQKYLFLEMSTSKHWACESSAHFKKRPSWNIQEYMIHGELPYSLCKVSSRYSHLNREKKRETNRSIHRWRINGRSPVWSAASVWLGVEKWNSNCQVKVPWVLLLISCTAEMLQNF